jgi:integrase
MPARPNGEPSFIAMAYGCLAFWPLIAFHSKYGGNALSEQFRNWCDAAGLPKRCKVHGLRKAACRRLAEHGCSEREIMAISGHATSKEIARYTKAADQARLARNALAKAVIR